MSKKPSFQFYPGDWRKDPALARVSKTAKGVFIDIMCLAFECEVKGVFKTGKHIWTIEELSYAVGGDMDENKKCIGELLDKNVLKKNRKNVIFQSRIKRDAELLKVRREAGSKGGNPNLVNQNAKQKTTPSSSTSSSTSIYKRKIEKESWEIERASFKNSGDWIFKMCRQHDVDLAWMDRAIDAFLMELDLKEDYKDVKELKRHFVNWFNAKKEKYMPEQKRMVV